MHEIFVSISEFAVALTALILLGLGLYRVIIYGIRLETHPPGSENQMLVIPWLLPTAEVKEEPYIMSDKYQGVRALPWPALALALGIDQTHFRRDTRKSDWVGPCPLHGSKTNQNCFRYNDDGRFNCFSCGEKGSGAIDFTKTYKQLGFQAAVELLLPVVGVEVPATAEGGVLEAPIASSAVLKPYKGSYAKFKVDCPWLNERIPDTEVRERYGVFCYNNPARKSAYSGRVMIPVKDVEGQLFGYLGRRIDMGEQQHAEHSNADSKYLFPAGLPKSRFLFGAHELASKRSLPVKVLFVVESPFAVMKFHQLGFDAVSPFGWNVSPEQYELLQTLAKGIVYLPDRNKQEQASGKTYLLASRTWLRFPVLPDGVQDPEQLDANQIRSLL